jgi:hypothetical protein
LRGHAQEPGELDAHTAAWGTGDGIREAILFHFAEQVVDAIFDVDVQGAWINGHASPSFQGKALKTLENGQ